MSNLLDVSGISNLGQSLVDFSNAEFKNSFKNFAEGVLRLTTSFAVVSLIQGAGTQMAGTTANLSCKGPNLEPSVTVNPLHNTYAKVHGFCNDWAGKLYPNNGYLSQYGNYQEREEASRQLQNAKNSCIKNVFKLPQTTIFENTVVHSEKLANIISQYCTALSIDYNTCLKDLLEKPEGNTILERLSQ